FLAHPFRPVAEFKLLLTTRPFDRMNVAVLSLAAASLGTCLGFPRPEPLAFWAAVPFPSVFPPAPAAFRSRPSMRFPGLGSFRVPSRALEVTVLALAALSALGLSGWIDEPRWPRRVGMSAIGCAVCIAIARSTSGDPRVASIWGAGFFAVCWAVPRFMRWGGVLALAVFGGYTQAAWQPNVYPCPADSGVEGAMRGPERTFRPLEASYPGGRAILLGSQYVAESWAAKTGTLLRFPVMGDDEPLLP